MNENLKEKFGRVGVLMGGDSSEREISLKSGQAVYKALEENGVDVVSFDIKNTADVLRLKEDIVKANFDIAFIAMHGVFGEDGQLQALLEELNIPYTGSGPNASKLAMDKIASRKIFESNGILVPKFLVGGEPDFDYKALGFPLVVKPSDGGSSIGLSLVKNEEELLEAFLRAKKYSEKVIIEEYVKGSEVTVGILEDRPLPVIMLKPKEEFYNYKAKYTSGLTEYLVPALISPAATKLCQEIALKAHRALGMRCFSRVDIILKDGRLPVVLEVNSIPGLTALSLLPKAAKEEGLNFGGLCIKLLKSALSMEKNSEKKKKLSLSTDKRSKKINFKWTTPLLTALVLAVAFLWSVRWAIVSLPDFKIFKLQNCYVEGRDIKLSGKEAFDYCLLSRTGSLLEIDLETLRDRVFRAHPELKRITVIKDYPDTIRIVVEERKPFAEIRAEESFIVDEEGFVLSKSSENTQDGLPAIIGVSSRYIKENTFNQTAGLKKAIEILKMLKANRVKDKYGVQRIDVSNPDNISFFIKKGVEIKLGKDEFREKLDKIDPSLSNLDLTQIKYIDLRFKDLIVGPR